MQLSRRTRLVLLAALGLGAALVGAELLVTAVALPTIVADLADWTQLRRASWVVNGYLLAYIAAMPLAGRLGDRFGVPGPFAASLAVFALGSMLAGAAQDLEQLIAARLIQGAGGGALVPLATAGASDLFRGHERHRALGAIGALTFLGMAIGPFVGAAVLDGLDFSAALGARGLSGSVLAAVFAPSWRWIFFVGVPPAFLAALYTWAAASGWRREHRAVAFDLPGAVLATLALGAGLLAVTSLGSEAGDGLPSPLLTGLVSLIAAVLTVFRLRRAPEPFLDLRLLRRPVMTGAVLLSLLTGYALATAIVGGAVFVDRVRYGGPADQRLALGGLAAAMAVGALLSGYALRRLGAVAVSVAGLAVGAAGLLAFSRLGPQGSLQDAAGGLALFGLGFGLTVTPRSAVAVEAAGRRAFGMAAAAVTVARMAGMALGLAVLTALGSDRIEALSVVLTDAAARDAVLPPELRGRPLQDGLVVDVLERWASEQAASILAGLFVLAAGIMALALLPALAMGGGGGPLPGAASERSDDDEDRRPLVAV